MLPKAEFERLLAEKDAEISRLVHELVELRKRCPHKEVVPTRTQSGAVVKLCLLCGEVIPISTHRCLECCG